ncbi:cyclase/dehydrase, partial [Desarmillaria tabescens]
RYKRSELYAIVSDVSSYPQFIPYCTGSRILHKATRDGSTIMDAELTVGFMAFQESYVSKVTCTPFSSVEAVASSSTPMFKSLQTIWRFQPTGEKEHNTLVSLDLAFDFVNPFYASLSSTFFDKVSGGMVAAFEKRCEEVCGRGRV